MLSFVLVTAFPSLTYLRAERAIPEDRERAMPLYLSYYCWSHVHCAPRGPRSLSGEAKQTPKASHIPW
jgi:hypothetical protein